MQEKDQAPLKDYIRSLRSKPHGELSEDERESLRFAELAEQQKGEPPGSPPRGSAARWVWMLQRLEAFRIRHGRLPHDNNRRLRSERNRDELQLIAWLRYQRSAAKRTTLCTWQVRRLEQVPGFQWAPMDEAWWRDYRRYSAFLAAHERPPVRRGRGEETQLALWAERQRARYRAGTLEEPRRRALRALRIWTW